MRSVRRDCHVVVLLVSLVSLLCGCQTVLYRPTQEGKMPYPAASKTLTGLKGRWALLKGGRLYKIADVRWSSAGMDFIYGKLNLFGMENGETAKLTFDLKSPEAPSVSKINGSLGGPYLVSLSGDDKIYLDDEKEAVSCADALFVLKRSSGPPELSKDLAADSGQQPSTEGGENKNFVGKIEKVNRLNPGFFNGLSPDGIWFKILVLSDNGEEVSFYERRKTNITYSDGKPFPNGWRPMKGPRVEVTYSVIRDGNYAGSNEALTIRYLDKVASQ